ncbi:MAG TPA: cob(I)yrinic acid a,c-diamide adenosyltransferase [Candidatus Marinimicrobia bacterium]|nr:cob(I)yrinic acid a,c-diamide adenosyltransferase [Candidatus Neomarinimicrobiota bacterium]HQE96465.1 cob(I)yrinic acid a,c-diamide adenosyltransferase [Candidatus Neomarinimicrobiota bacterium]HQH56594.1 cob(I)yrinic acid a,c-diamide adenosyltransferase [Candidatus Neomarinimicrobiota bacterium]HQH56968.1 cob(I)yrinic acid a,c-diamide adenosyltransferase [Candidatus Neomarinimicrobiota bacterium]HQK12257.1 cob(I)yrinic acid a,c-diamide adenosyltransferase [Candidatus Neomarinimicrobiota ba
MSRFQTKRFRMQGLIQVYTGDGKGKTTAALGLALRAAGAGLKVFIGQFLKGAEYSEIKALRQLAPGIEIKQYGRRCFIKDKPDEEDIRLAQNGLVEMDSVIQSGDYDLVILDEANIAVYYNLFSVDELLKVVQNRPKQVEIVITGRNADPRIIAAADLVTEMREIKHYYQEGIAARLGIEM